MSNKKATLTIEFDNEELLREFAGWFCDGGGEDIFHEAVEMRKGKKISVQYHKQDETKAANDPDRYGPFLFGDEKKFLVKVR